MGNISATGSVRGACVAVAATFTVAIPVSRMLVLDEDSTVYVATVKVAATA